MRLILISLLIHAATSTCPIPVDETQPSTRDDELTFRLPRNVKPNRYHITLHPDLSPNLNPATFTGSVRIEFTALENTRNITLKIRTLDIDHDSLQVTDSNNLGLPIVNVEDIVTLEFLIIHLEDDLTEGNDYVVSVERYSGILNLQNAGLYLATYYDEDGTERRMATTQFESTNARRAFPSFDEPEWKATYITRLRRTADFISISNEDIQSTEELEIGGVTIYEDIYRETVKMSTYLNAFIVTQFKYIEDEDNNQKVYARPEYVDAGWVNYALQTGVATIKALDEFTQIPYSATVQKLDQIGIPDDSFSPGAMENWGLVTYRESYLLYHETITTTTQLQRMVTVIAHEYAHQWFGNLVTMSWWRYLWLNEGFATYFEYQAASVVEPTWRLMEQLALEVQYAFEYDSLESTQPMNYETESGGSGPSAIVYEKAGSVIRMAENFLTTEVFRQGLNIYLTNRALDVAEPEDLYNAWQEALVAAGKQALLPPDTDVNATLAPWADQKGYPIVTLTRNYVTNQISVSQIRFLLKDIPGEDINVVWPVPLNIYYASDDSESDFSDTTADFWLLTHAATIQPDTDFEFIIANKKQTGYYRVNYDENNWGAIIRFLQTDQFTKIDPINRAQLLDDAFNLARAGVLPYTLPFSLSTYLERETDYIPFTSFFNALRYLRPILASREGYEEFKNFVSTLTTPIAESLTFDERANDEHVVKLNRVNVMNWRCDLDLGDCRESAITSFRAWKTDPNKPLTPNTQLYAYCGALRTGDQSDLDFLFETYQTERLDALRTRILNALGCSEDEAVLTRLMTMTLDPDVQFYKPADRQTAFTSVYNSGIFGLNAAYNFVKNNYAAISASTVNLNTIITGLSTRFSSEEQLTEFSAFLAQLEGVVPEATRNAARRNTEDNVNFAKAIMPSIVEFLEDYVSPSSTPPSSTSPSETTPVLETSTIVISIDPNDPTTTTGEVDPTDSTVSADPNDPDISTTTESTSTIATTSLALLVLGYLLSLFVK